MSYKVGEYVKCVGQQRIYIGQIIDIPEDKEDCDYVVLVIDKSPKKLYLSFCDGEGFDYCDFVNYEWFNLVQIDQKEGYSKFCEQKLKIL